MKKVTLFIFLMVLLLPISSFAKNPFRFLSPKKKNYTSFCLTLPASAPVLITLSEIDYKSDKTTVEKGYYNSSIKTEPAEIYLRHAIKNNSKKTITACYFQVQVYYTAFGAFDYILYDKNYVWENIRIKHGKSYAETSYEPFNASNKNHERIKKGMCEYITKVVYKVFCVKYSDGTSEGFNPDS
jgi:hypothetical protein